MSKIDELSRALGRIENEQSNAASAQQAMFERLDAVREAYDSLKAEQQARHADNLGRLDHLDECTDDLKERITEMAKALAEVVREGAETRRTLAMIQPLVVAPTLSARRRGTLMGISVILLSAAGWVVEHAVTGIVAWIWAHLSMKWS